MVVTRAYPVEVAGAFFTSIALALMVAGVAKLDAGNGLVFFIARAETYGYHGVSGYVRAALVPVAVVATATGLLLWPVLGVLALVPPAIAVADVLLAACRGFGSMRPTVLLDGVLLPLSQLALVAAAALAGLSGASLPLAWALPYLPVVALAALALRGRAPRTPYLPGTARDLWRHTAPRSAAGAIQAVFQRLDIVIVAALGGPVQAAVYTAATRFKVVGQLARPGPRPGCPAPPGEGAGRRRPVQGQGALPGDDHVAGAGDLADLARVRRAGAVAAARLRSRLRLGGAGGAGAGGHDDGGDGVRHGRRGAHRG
ncbi:hypothetical protein ACFSTC_04475 [Nonomuraea ferruginea]